MRFKANVMDERQMRRTLIRMSHEIIEKNRGVDRMIFVGIQRRGVAIAKEMAQIIKAVENENVPVGTIDITLYRDDLTLETEIPQVNETDLPFPITDSNVIIVDDVLYTGRTVRAAMEAVAATGRPKTIQLAVLIDRGNRELPIGANYIGKTLSTTRDELVSVSVKGIDGVSSVDIYGLSDND